MDSNIIKFLTRERVCVLSITLPDGTPHSATMHYSEEFNPLKLFIQTSNTTTKVQAFLDGEIKRAAVVIGFSEKDWLTLQMRGTIRIVSNPKELETIYKIHYKKHPDAEQYKGPKTVFLEFTPTWCRYTDFNTNPERIFESNT